MFPAAETSFGRLTFDPEPGDGAGARYAIVLAGSRDGVLLVEIAGRGWSVPSGRLEVHETSLHAARRETREEAGVELGRLRRIGRYRIESEAVTWADVYRASIARLEPFVATAESRGRRVIPLRDLSRLYAEWNALYAAVFAYAFADSSEGDAPPFAEVPNGSGVEGGSGPGRASTFA